MDAPPKITIGTVWMADGRAWEVYELLPFGRAKVRSGFRFGEMSYRSIRAAIALAAEQVSA